MGAALLAKLPKRVWGKSRNVTDNSPTRLGALRAALSYPKHDGVSSVWLTIVILVKVKCTLRGHILRFWAVWGDLGLCTEESFLPLIMRAYIYDEPYVHAVGEIARC